MTTIDLTIHKDRRARAIQRARQRNIVIPTFAQMKDPARIPAKVKEELKGVGLWDVDPRNLFRITWKNEPKAKGGRTPTLIGVWKEIPTRYLVDEMLNELYTLFELATRYLVDTYGAEEFKLVSLDIRAGMSFEEAFANQFGMSLTDYKESFFTRMEGYLH